MAVYDWSRFDVHMDIDASPESVFRRWATGEGMASFFSRSFDYEGRAAGELAQAGDRYRLSFHHPFDLTGEVLAVEPLHLAFTYGRQMRVDVTCEPRDGSARVRLVQSNIPTDETGRSESHLNCRSCWVYYLLNLKSVVEHGRDLREGGLPDNPVSINFGAAAESR